MSRSYMNGDSTFMRTENFLYDTRERLTTSQVTGQGQKVVTYDQTGNILTKTDAGTYTYNSTKVNALASVTFIRSGISTDLQTISYNSQNKATEISEDVNSYNIVYGADGERIKSQLYNNSVLTKTKYYAPGYEKITTTGGTVENHYIGSPYGLEAIIVKAGASETMYLAETDHLGSLTGLRDTAGVYVERYSYDPWGRRRNPADWSFNSVPVPTITDRGFTGHEHLDMFGLINMNGRLYDQVTGRFLNADPVIHNTFGAQGLNSFTYCLNNPLKYTDPSGFTFTENKNAYLLYREARMKGYPGSIIDFYDILEQYNFNGGGTGTIRIQWETKFGLMVNQSGYIVDEKTKEKTYLLPEIIYGIIRNEIAISPNSGHLDWNPIGYYNITLGNHTRAGGNPNEMQNAIIGTLDIFSAAAKDVVKISRGASTGGAILSAVAIHKIYNDLDRGSCKPGDYVRLGFNAFFLVADLVVPFSGYVPAIFDSYGFFEYYYHQFDVWDDTGYWVYYNWYGKDWRSIRIKP